ncbi:hypothetical protein LLS1_18260 [Leifsonia sp. LS1]|uniref:DUF6941 family protein n=1 Tax=Leifsonia sp. LS1 TaxID=2828483 RepID=UPI001CFEADA3|nr:hypothetical protein [Leifsonia sp. LS1]GIT80157.1 hypothetical protein LLS1_18260 [Leifsonia sp. LS1]
MILLCDYAEENAGKLNIIGGGFSRIFNGQGFDLSVAGKIWIPWSETNVRHRFELTLTDADGAVVRQGDSDVDVRVDAEFEVGRPPGMMHGTEADMPLVFRFRDLRLEPGRYTWQLSVDSAEAASVAFSVEA